MSGQVLVIGATGSVGSELVTLLSRTGERVRAATRDLAAARSPDCGVEFVEFDFERPETLAPALDGADRVFLIARPGDDHADLVAYPLDAWRKYQPVEQCVFNVSDGRVSLIAVNRAARTILGVLPD
jgi:uncharacterized protein YbjT (DUF2867 family)